MCQDTVAFPFFVSWFVFFSSECNQNVFKNGECWAQHLRISKLMEEDFHINYTCKALSFRESSEGYFTLLPPGKKK